MMHSITRLAARLFKGGFGKSLEIPVEPRTVNHSLPVGEYPALLWDGPEKDPPVVLLHGLQNGAWIWARVGALLAGKFNVIAPNMRGHGIDDAPESGYSLAETTADLRSLLDLLGVEVCHLAGHSWGGKVATHFAATYPSHVRSLVLADPVPPRGLNGILQRFPGLIDAAFAPERVAHPNETEFLQAAEQLVYLVTGDAVDARVWAEKFKRTEGGGYEPRLPQRAFDELVAETFCEDISLMAATIRCPVMLLKPYFTVAFLPWETASLRRAYGRAQFRRIAGDHSFIHSNAIDTAQAMDSFLQGFRSAVE